MVYSFNIDEKSLYRGTTNDYKNGQSATIATPLNQSKDSEKWHKDIYEFLDGYPSKNIDSLPSVLKDRCLRNTTSQSKCKLTNFHVFSKFSLDGIPFEVDASFAMYVKEEISENIIKRDGTRGRNTHLGRQRLTYPVSLNYQLDDYNIDNAKILEKIIEVNGGFAYVVNGFDVNIETQTLNFRTTMVGIKGVFLSNVFKRGKGVGVKLNVNGINFDEELFSKRKESVLSEIESNTFYSLLEKIQDSSRKNGIIGEEFVYNNLNMIIGSNAESPCHVSKNYPQSPYDIECYIEGKKKYIEVKSTSKEKKVFLMSRGERRFMEKYEKDYILVLVTNVRSNHRKFSKYNRKQIENSSIMEQEFQSIKYIVK